MSEVIPKGKKEIEERIAWWEKYIDRWDEELEEMSKDYENMPEIDRIDVNLKIYRNRLLLLAILEKLS